MPRLIFKCPYIKGGTSSATAHLENYVKYMATRNGVERIDPGRSEWPATSKQKKMVEQILRDFPLSRGMFEYADKQELEESIIRRHYGTIVMDSEQPQGGGTSAGGMAQGIQAAPDSRKTVFRP